MDTILKACLPGLSHEILQEITEHSSIRKFRAKEYVIHQAQSIRFLPIVIEGSVKVCCDEDGVQFLLYYVNSGESCIFSYAHMFSDSPAEFHAIAEQDSKLALLPIHKVKEWFHKYPAFSAMILKGYQKHYDDLLHSVKQITCYNLEERLIKYLRDRASLEKTNLLKISHQEIASDLGTSREVISRLMKKLEANGDAIQAGRKIKVG
ncbi:MAG: Crp/Fnr family transcriptional regulator [Roseivirga sp.]|nr:Crp/Fnr family transcriptional regulator [Roseivirga sp.]